MKLIKQFRYYGDGDSRNYPTNLSKEELVYQNIFTGHSSITQLGIQGQPNTTLFLNGQDFPIVLGETGIYEIDLQNYGYINSIRFTDESLSRYVSKGDDRLLIDIIYEG